MGGFIDISNKYLLIINRFVKRSESVQQESSMSTKCKTPGTDSNHVTNSTSARNLGRHQSSSKDNMYALNIKPGRSFLAQNKKGKGSFKHSNVIQSPFLFLSISRLIFH